MALSKVKWFRCCRIKSHCCKYDGVASCCMHERVVVGSKPVVAGSFQLLQDRDYCCRCMLRCCRIILDRYVEGSLQDYNTGAKGSLLRCCGIGTIDAGSFSIATGLRCKCERVATASLLFSYRIATSLPQDQNVAAGSILVVAGSLHGGYKIPILS